MEEDKKKRGRKPKVIKNPEIQKEQSVEVLTKKKRGRKKKWETEDNNRNYSALETNDYVTFENSKVNERDLTSFNTNNLIFGNLKIQIHKKEEENKNIEDFFVDNKNPECELYLSDDDKIDLLVTEDADNVKQTKQKTVKIYNNNKEIETKNNLRCYNCHHFFEGSNFYLPYEYSDKLDRFKITGNFCSPNCVKSYCIKSKEFCNKLYLVGFYYRKLFGPNFKIKPAPSILNLKEYGGNMSIEEFRKNFYSNDIYTHNTINSKIIKMN